MKISPRTAVILIALACIAVVLLASFSLAHADEVSSTRASQYEWQCEDANGNLISGHTRQDKAFQSCYNAALATGQAHYVRGGVFRVEATIEASPAPDPGPDPQPDPDPLPDPDPDPDPGPQPLVTFGPVTSTTTYPSMASMKQNGFRWEIVFTANSLIDKVAGEPRANTIMGLASRDQSGQDQKGHLSIYIEDQSTGDHRIVVRNQDISGGQPTVTLVSTTRIIAGQEYEVVISLEEGAGIGLLIDDQLEASDPNAFGLADNDLPLVVGGLCSRCSADGSIGPDRPLDGRVYMAIWDDPTELPQPTASLELSWANPVDREDGTPLAPDELQLIRLFQVAPGTRQEVAGVDPDQSSHEITDLMAGLEYCFRLTAVDTAGLESRDSEEVCGVP